MSDKNSKNLTDMKAENPALTVNAGNKGKELAEKDEKLEKHIAELRESYMKIGALHPVIETQYGIAAGASRIRIVSKIAQYVQYVKIV
jgi:hypothetical protein